MLNFYFLVKNKINAYFNKLNYKNYKILFKFYFILL